MNQQVIVLWKQRLWTQWMLQLQVVTSEMTGTVGETDLQKITFGDGSQQNLDNFSAKKIAACYAQLDDEKQQQYR